MIGVFSGVAFAQEAGAEPVPVPVPGSAPILDPDPEPAIRSKTAAPGEAHGRVQDERNGAQKLLWAPKLVFALPRFLFQLATGPLYGIAKLEDRHKIQERIEDFFYNDERTFGIYPIAFFATGLGLNVGAELVHKDLFGHKEGLKLSTGFGGRDRQNYIASLHSGSAISKKTWLAVNVGYTVRANRRFSGIGNADAVRVEDVTLPLNVFGDEAIPTRFKRREAHANVTASHRVSDRIKLTLMHQWRWRRLTDIANDNGTAIDEVYDAAQLIGLERNFISVYHELKLGFSNRMVVAPDLPLSLPSKGGRIDVFGGVQNGVGDDPSRFGRLGVDGQLWVPLFMGDRVLRLCLRVHTLIGDEDRVPFLDWPVLGGTSILRGYSQDQFRVG